MKQILLIIFVFAIFASSILAQTTSCNLQLEVYKFQADSEAEPVQINKATAFLQKEKSKTKVKADLQNELPYFANLTAGNYNSTVSISGYKTTTKEIEIDCSMANDQNIVSEVIFLWEGDTKETVKMKGGAFAVTGDDSNQLKTAPVKTQEETFTSTPLRTEPVKIQGETHTSNPSGKNVINGSAAYLPRPAYPAAARAVKASGLVEVEVLIDEIGRVIYAKAVSGHPLLRAAAVKAAKEAKFSQTRLQELPVKVAGIIAYNFVP